MVVVVSDEFGAMIAGRFMSAIAADVSELAVAWFSHW